MKRNQESRQIKWTSKGDDNPPWFAHLGNLLPSTKLQKLITFLVELKRPGDPLGVAKRPRYNTRNLKRICESFHNSQLNAGPSIFLMQPKAPFYSGGVFNKLKTRRDTSTYTFISMGGQKVEAQKLTSAFALCQLLFSALVSISDGYICYDFLPNLLQREFFERSRSQLSGASCFTQCREAVWEI